MSYDSSNDEIDIESKWDTCRTTLTTGREDCGAVAIDDYRMVVTGGYDIGVNYLASVELFDIRAEDDKTEELPSMNSARGYHKSIRHGNYVYAIGGWNSICNRLSSVERINISSITASSWEMVAPMEEGRVNFAVAKHEEYIYVFGGCVVGGSNSSRKSERYNVFSDKWESIAVMKQPRQYHAAVTVGDKIYVMGGEKSSSEYHNSMEIFDTTYQKWEDGTDMPVGLSGIAAVIVNDWIVVIGGANHGYCNNDIFVFNTIDNVWTTIIEAKLNIPRRSFATTVLEQYAVVVVGGRDKNYNNLDTVEYGNFYQLTGILTKPNGQTVANMVPLHPQITKPDYEPTLWDRLTSCYQIEPTSLSPKL